jgi:hypothetical protein
LSWYSIVKSAQLWNTEGFDSYGSLSNEIERMYELEYKFSMVKNSPFNGIEQRKQNILKQLEYHLKRSIVAIAETILPAFDNWLKSHALLNPRLWAEQRLQEFGDDASIRDLLMDLKYALLGYDSNNVNKSILNLTEQQSQKQNRWISNTIFTGISQNINQCPAWSAMLENMKNDYADMREDDLRNEFESGQSDYSTKKELEKAIQEEKKNISEMTLQEYMDDYGYNLEDLIEGADESYALELLKEIQMVVIFPKWFAKWKPQGIESTRANVESVFQKLLQVQGMDVSNAVGVISLALQSVHQTGSMLDYIEEHTGESATEIKQVLDAMTAGADINIWNEQLREVGVGVPENLMEPETEENIQEITKPKNIISATF